MESNPNCVPQSAQCYKIPLRNLRFLGEEEIGNRGKGLRQEKKKKKKSKRKEEEEKERPRKDQLLFNLKASFAYY